MIKVPFQLILNVSQGGKKAKQIEPEYLHVMSLLTACMRAITESCHVTSLTIERAWHEMAEMKGASF